MHKGWPCISCNIGSLAWKVNELNTIQLANHVVQHSSVHEFSGRRRNKQKEGEVPLGCWPGVVHQNIDFRVPMAAFDTYSCQVCNTMVSTIYGGSNSAIDSISREER